MGSMMNPSGLLRLLRLLKPPAEELDEFGPTKAEQILGTSNPILQNEHTDEELVPTDMPSLQAYRDYLSKGTPKHEDYKPSTGRQIMGRVQGFLAGATGRPNKVSDILNAPYNDAMEDYSNEGRGLAAGAKLDVDLNNQQRLENQNKRAIEARIAESKREIAHETIEAENAQRRFDVTDARDRQQHIERLEAEKRTQELLLARINTKGDGDSSDGTWTRQENAQGQSYRMNNKTGKTEPIIDPYSNQPAMAKVSDRTRRSADDLDEVITQTQEVKGLAEKYKNTFKLGPGTGGISDWFSRNVSSRDPDVNKMYTLFRKIANNELYAKSGAQINNKEYQRLRATLADPNATESSIFSDLNSFLESTYRQRERFRSRGVWDDDAYSSGVDPNAALSKRQTKSGGTYRRLP